MSERPTRVALWGLGAYYALYSKKLIDARERERVEFVAVTAAELPSAEAIDGIPVVAREELASIECDFVMVLAKNYEPIYAQAQNQYGIPRDKLVNWQLLCVPGFDFIDYRELRKRRISIIGRECWGGIIARTLQLESRSPLDNTLLKEMDYLTLLEDPVHYLRDCELKFVEFRFNSDNCEYPVFSLDGIPIRFWHDYRHDPETTLQDWNRRRARVNWDGLFAEFSTLTPDYERRFHELAKDMSRVCFVPYVTHCERSIHVPVSHADKSFIATVEASAFLGQPACVYQPIQTLLCESSKSDDKLA